MITIETIRHWISLAAQLKTLKAQELSLRKQVSDSILGKNVAGTKHYAFDQVEVKCSASKSFSVKREDVMAMQDVLTDAEKECIVWKPSIDKKKYDALPKSAELRKIVSMSIGTPTVTAIDGEVK